MLGSGSSSSLHWSATAAGERWGVRAAFGWTRATGVLPGQDLKRPNFSLGVRLEPWKGVEVDAGLLGGSLDATFPRASFATDDYLGVALMYPTSPQDSTIFALLDNTETSRTARRLVPRLAVTHRVTPRFSHRLVAGADLDREERTSNYRFPVDVDAHSSFESVRDMGRYSVDYRARFRVLDDATGRHSLDLLAGVRASWDRGEHEFSRTWKYPSRGWNRIEASSDVELDARGAVADVRYERDGRFFAEAGIGLDKEEGSGLPDRGTLLSHRVGVSWIAFQAADPAAIGTVRLHAAHGQAERVPTVVDESLAVEPFDPERMSELELGVETTLLRERVGLGVTAFRRETRDIPSRVFDPAVGWGTDQMGFRNDGVEAELSARILTGANLSWSARLGVAWLGTEIFDLDEDSPLATLYQAGEPIGSYRGHRYYIDEAAERVILTEDSAVIGSALPTWEGVLETEAAIRRAVRLRALLDWKTGFHVHNGTEHNRDLFSSERKVRRDELPTSERLLYFGPYYWPTGVRPITDIGSTPYIQDGSYLRLREVSVTWELPAAWAASFRANAASLTVAGRNLALWSRYPGFDPEVTDSTSLLRNYDLFVLPQPSRWTARITVQF